MGNKISVADSEKLSHSPGILEGRVLSQDCVHCQRCVLTQEYLRSSKHSLLVNREAQHKLEVKVKVKLYTA